MAALPSAKASANTDTSSGSVMVLSTGGTAVLTGDFSKLLGETPTPTSTTILPTSTSQSIPTNLSSTAQIDQSSPIPTPTVAKADTDGLSNTQLGAIIGGAAGGVLLLLCLIGCIMYKRKKKATSFKRGRGITPSMVFDSTDYHPHPDRSFDQQSTYSFNTPQNAFGSSQYPTHLTPSAPSENVTATVDKLYSIKKYNHESPPPPPQQRPPPPQRGANNGARLSKYNYLTQAFSQMRASYATQEPEQAMYDNSHQGLAKPPFVQYPDPVAPSPAPSMDAPSITLFNENNESKVLHQGHALPTTIQPVMSTATVSKKLYFPGNNAHRDSTLSDVSQYSTFSSSSNPYGYSDDPNTTVKSSPLTDKPYTYI